MERKLNLYFWIFVLIVCGVLLFFMFKGSITGNPVYKIYDIRDFPGIYIDFGPTQSELSSKWGSAAVGNIGEYWNAPFILDSQYTFLPLRYANGDLSNMKVQLSHLDKSGKIKSNLGDVMFESYIYSEDINKVSSVSISNLISGSYDIYLYGNLEDSNANYELYRYSSKNPQGQAIFFGLRSTYVNTDVLLKENWEEGVQFVVYRDVEFEEGDSMEVIVKSFDKNGERTKSFTSGMQIVKAGTPLAYNVSSNVKKLDCFDSDGGINYSTAGKIYLNGRFSSEDLCDNQNTYLTELTCEDGVKSIDIHECENGCVDGFCIPDFKFAACNGCLFNQICIAKGSRVENKYCDNDKFLKLQKSEDNSCSNDFECQTNSCFDRVCLSLDEIAREKLGFKYEFVKLLCRITNYDLQDYDSCLSESFTPLIDEKKESKIVVEDKQSDDKKEETNYSGENLPKTSLG